MLSQSLLRRFFSWCISVIRRFVYSSKWVWSFAVEPDCSDDTHQPCFEIGEDRPVVIYTGDPYEVLGPYRIEQPNPYYVIIRGGSAIAVRSRLAPEKPITYCRTCAALGRKRMEYEAWRKRIVPLLARLPVEDPEYPAELRAYMKAHPLPDELTT